MNDVHPPLGTDVRPAACAASMKSVRPLGRTRSRLDIPSLRTLSGFKTRPHRNRRRPTTQEIVIEKPQYGLSWFRVRFGLLQLTAYTKDAM